MEVMLKKQNKTFTSEIYIMRKAADKAAVGLVRDFGELEKLQVSRKGVKNYVTSADLRSERKIIEELKKFDYSILSEEAGFKAGSQLSPQANLCWVIDPIDGTNNFRRGIPYFCINIALTQDDEPVAALILDPIRSTCYKSIVNTGAVVDGHARLRVAKANKINEAVIAYHRLSIDQLEKLDNQQAILRQTGSVSLDLAYVAAGKYDAAIAKDVSWWDIAAGILIVKESGGFVRYTKNNDTYSIIAACSSTLIKELESI